MTLDQIRYFSAVATYEHVGRAAIAVAISPSVISATISSLEDELGCKLFRKSGRRIEITDDGKRLHERFKTLLAQFEGLKTEMRGEPESLSGRFRFGASHFLASRTLLNAWQGLKNKHRDVIADIYSMNTSHAIAEVISGRLDLAVCFSPMTHSSLKEIKLLEGELVVVVRKNHPILRRPAGDRLRFLAEGSAVIHKSNQGAESCESHPIFEAMGFQPKIEMYFDDDETAIRRVISSESWTFVPDIVAKEYAKDVKVIRLPAKFGKATYHVSAIARRERANERWLQELF